MTDLEKHVAAWTAYRQACGGLVEQRRLLGQSDTSAEARLERCAPLSVSTQGALSRFVNADPASVPLELRGALFRLAHQVNDMAQAAIAEAREAADRS